MLALGGELVGRGRQLKSQGRVFTPDDEFLRVPWFWSSMVLQVGALILLLLPESKKNLIYLNAACVMCSTGCILYTIFIKMTVPVLTGAVRASNLSCPENGSDQAGSSRPLLT